MLQRTVSVIENKCRYATLFEAALLEASGQSFSAYALGDKLGQLSFICKDSTDKIALKTLSFKNESRDVSEVFLMIYSLEGAEWLVLNGLREHISKIEAIIFEEIGHNEASVYLTKSGFVGSPLGFKDKLPHYEIVRV